MFASQVETISASIRPVFRRFCWILLPLVLVRPASAQIGFEGLLSNITDISLSLTCWDARSDFVNEGQECSRDRFGYGVEVLWGLARVPIGKADKSIKPVLSWDLVEKKEEYRGSHVDSTRSYVLKKSPREDERPFFFVELGLGYGQSQSLIASESNREVRGIVRETPAVAVYGSLKNDNGILSRLMPYVGIRSGLIQLHNAQFFNPTAGDTATVYSGTAQTFQLGVAGGLILEVNRMQLFAEYSYDLRQFPSVQWAASGGKVTSNFPRKLDFSGSTVSVGVQLHLRDPK